MRKYPPTRTSPLPNLNIKLNIVCDPETPEQKTTEKKYITDLKVLWFCQKIKNNINFDI